MKTISTFLSSGGTSSASTSGSRTVGDAVRSRSSLKRFRPGGPAPLRKKSFRHHLDQTLGKESASSMVPVVVDPDSPVLKKSPTSPVKPVRRKAQPADNTTTTKALFPRVQDARDKPVSPASSGRIAVATSSGEESRFPQEIRKSERPEDVSGVRRETFPAALLPSGKPAPPDRTDGPAPPAHSRYPEGIGARSGGTVESFLPGRPALSKVSTLPAKVSSSPKEKADAGRSLPAPLPSSVRNGKGPDDSFPSVLREHKGESAVRDPSPEETGAPRPSFSVGPSETHPEDMQSPGPKGTDVNTREESSPPESVVPGSAPPVVSEGVDGLKKTVEVPDFSRKVADAVRNGGGEVTLRVHPPALGPVQVRVHLEEGGKTVSLSIRVRDESVRKALVSSGKMLRERLEKEGFSLARMDVSTVVSASSSVPSVSPATDSSPTFTPPSPSFPADTGGAQTSFFGRESGGEKNPGFPEEKDSPVPISGLPETGRGRPILEDAGYHRIA